MLYSKRSAFSAFEVLCVIIIVGILAGVGIKYMGHLHHKQCVLRLKAKLASTQNTLSQYYTQAFMKAQIEPAVARQILQTVTLDSTPTCRFSLESNALKATIDSQILYFSIQPSDLSLNPIISCNLSQPLCKEFSDRILDK
ncbi:Tfp pilus assembly protein PilE [Helicobacter cinaedi]|uniref:Tfp pilus assembly protein PilE n=1 Tax=Helicobacter cinaedi TaxID=213 RepID=A0A377JV13_9HELI|nr:prepilin-type cleavage/methylation domain-containing protein [Helicobacter cinaedi]STP11633.1 Tfp pilus assembly protein PilE [Helicobacter cinaedi]